MPCLDADNIVFMRIETGLATEDGAGDLVLVNLVRAPGKRTAGGEQQKATQLDGAGKRLAGRYSLNQRPSFVFGATGLRWLKGNWLFGRHRPPSLASVPYGLSQYTRCLERNVNMNPF